jgi:hypothetical protein
MGNHHPRAQTRMDKHLAAPLPVWASAASYFLRLFNPFGALALHFQPGI